MTSAVVSGVPSQNLTPLAEVVDVGGRVRDRERARKVGLQAALRVVADERLHPEEDDARGAGVARVRVVQRANRLGTPQVRSAIGPPFAEPGLALAPPAPAASASSAAAKATCSNRRHAVDRAEPSMRISFAEPSRGPLAIIQPTAAAAMARPRPCASSSSTVQPRRLSGAVTGNPTGFRSCSSTAPRVPARRTISRRPRSQARAWSSTTGRATAAPTLTAGRDVAVVRRGRWRESPT